MWIAWPNVSLIAPRPIEQRNAATATIAVSRTVPRVAMNIGAISTHGVSETVPDSATSIATIAASTAAPSARTLASGSLAMREGTAAGSMPAPILRARA